MSQVATDSRLFHLPRRGNTDLEYEDAGAIAPGLSAMAIADGATDSSYSGLWARLLTDAFVRFPAPCPDDWCHWLPPLQQSWESQLGDLELPWYAEAKLRQGAFASFLGVVMAPGTSRWRAIAVGDCCLFHIRQQTLLTVFPMTAAAEFNNRPSLVGSRMAPAVLLQRNHIKMRDVDVAGGDLMWLMTDALAMWYLQEHEAGRQPCRAVEQVLNAGSQEGFRIWVEERRSASKIRNDDVTLMAIRF